MRSSRGCGLAIRGEVSAHYGWLEPQELTRFRGHFRSWHSTGGHDGKEEDGTSPAVPEGVSAADGAAVRVYTVAASEGLAVTAISAALATLGLRLVDIEWNVDDSEVEWENPNSPGGERLRAEARLRSLPIFDTFHSW